MRKILLIAIIMIISLTGYTQVQKFMIKKEVNYHGRMLDSITYVVDIKYYDFADTVWTVRGYVTLCPECSSIKSFSEQKKTTAHNTTNAQWLTFVADRLKERHPGITNDDIELIQ